MPAGFSGHSATRVDVWVPMTVAMRDVPGWNLDAFRNVVSLLARVEEGHDATAAAQATAAIERRVTLVSLTGVRSHRPSVGLPTPSPACRCWYW